MRLLSTDGGVADPAGGVRVEAPNDSIRFRGMVAESEYRFTVTAYDDDDIASSGGADHGYHGAVWGARIGTQCGGSRPGLIVARPTV